MSINFGQIILDAQRLANRLKDLDTSSSALLIEAESNNRTLEAMRQFQDDMDSLNKLARTKTNSDMINRINQQNPSMREIRQENRELKALLEDQQRTMELIMHKYREQMQTKIFQTRLQFKDLSNAKFENDLHRKSDKIYEMAAVMQNAASVDDEAILKEIEENSRLRIENQGLREILKAAQEFGSISMQPSGIFDDNLAQNLSICSNTTASISSNLLNSSLTLTTTINNLNNNNNLNTNNVNTNNNVNNNINNTNNNINNNITNNNNNNTNDKNSTNINNNNNSNDKDSKTIQTEIATTSTVQTASSAIPVKIDSDDEDSSSSTTSTDEIKKNLNGNHLNNVNHFDDLNEPDSTTNTSFKLTLINGDSSGSETETDL